MSRAAGKITADFVKAINARVTGHTPKHVNTTYLQSAIDRPANKEYYEPNSSVADLAASLGFGLNKNHPFSDGNKRTAHGTVEAFLQEYGYRFSSQAASEIEQAHLKVANGEINDDSELAKIYAKHIKKA